MTPQADASERYRKVYLYAPETEDVLCAVARAAAGTVTMRTVEGTA